MVSFFKSFYLQIKLSSFLSSGQVTAHLAIRQDTEVVNQRSAHLSPYVIVSAFTTVIVTDQETNDILSSASYMVHQTLHFAYNNLTCSSEHCKTSQHQKDCNCTRLCKGILSWSSIIPYVFYTFCFPCR